MSSDASDPKSPGGGEGVKKNVPGLNVGADLDLHFDILVGISSKLMPTPPQAGSLLHQTDDSPKSADPTVRPTNSNRQLTGHTRTVFPVPLRPVDYFPKRKASYCSGLAVSAAIRPPVSLITTTKT